MGVTLELNHWLPAVVPPLTSFFHIAFFLNVLPRDLARLVCLECLLRAWGHLFVPLVPVLYSSLFLEG